MLNLHSVVDSNTIAAIVIATMAVVSFSINKKRSQSNIGKSKKNGDDDDNSNCDRDQLKSQLKSLLSKRNSSTAQEDVIAVIDKLVALNPPPKDCFKTDLFSGNFKIFGNAPFPGMIENDDDIARYTLGRMSFNIFQPNKLICTVKSAHNIVAADNGIIPSGDGSTFMYDLLIDITIQTTPNDGHNREINDSNGYGEIEAIMRTRGFCHPSKTVNNRLMVTFTGSSLRPKKNENQDKNKAVMLQTKWTREFENAYQKANQERSYMGWVMYYGLQWFMGLTYPTDNSGEDQTFQFEMKKPKTRHLDVLYLDEDMRIIRGFRGTVVVTERK